MDSAHLTAIRKILSPPSQPVDAVGEWKEVEQELGIELPEDYKQLVSCYGTGMIGHILEVFNLLKDRSAIWKQIAFVRDQNETVFNELKSVAQMLGRDTNVDHPLPYPFFPDNGGLFPWGRAFDGWAFWWLTEGPPRNWKIVSTYNATEKHRVEADISTVDFLASLFKPHSQFEFALEPVFTPTSPY